MFEGCRGDGSGGGVPDQFRHYIASRTSISLPISFPPPLPLPPPPPHHGVAASVISSTFAAAGCGGFDSYPPAALVFPPPPPPPPSHHNHHHHNNGLQSSSSVSNNKNSTNHHHDNGVNNKEEANNLVVELERERSSSSSSSILSISIPEGVVLKTSWTNDEILALLRIRSAMENWFPDFTWEHVSRKLAEVGFEKSAEKCKEKFEEESRNFSSMNYSKFFVSSDFDELYHVHGHHHHHHQNQQEKAPAPDSTVKKDCTGEKEIVMEEEEEEEEGNNGLSVGCDEEKKSKIEMGKKKRKRESEEFEMFKGLCEGIVRKINEQQEELHNKIMEEMIRRDEESIAREEAWKTQEIDRINQEMEIRAKEQAVALERQTKIIHFLNKFTSSDYNYPYDQNSFQQFFTTDQQQQPTSSSSTQNTPSPEHEPDHDHDHDQHGCSRKCNTNTNTRAATVPQKFSMDEKLLGERDISITGKRWPRDEVMALINLRCSFNNNNNNNSNNNEDTNGSWKGPLWERISEKMSELGYQRSAKRCKEKWENINKYFRKTKDNKKKRSMDSRTCPYFHQLSNLYRQSPGTRTTLVPQNP